MRLGRRKLVKLLGASPLLLAAPVPAAAAPNAATAGGPIEPGAGAWRTWVLATGEEIQPPIPPDSASEIAAVRALENARDAEALDRIAYWDTGSPGYRWNEIAIDRGLTAGLAAARGARMMALLNVAIHDATIAAWAAKYSPAHSRPRPIGVDPTLQPALPTPNSPSYPSEHAVAAGAAQAVLSHLFPKDAELLAARAEEAGRSRVSAGLHYPSDVDAGLALGRAVGGRVVEWAKRDGSDARWTGTVPVGPGLWKGTAPVEPLAGTWKTFALGPGEQFRPPPPPAHDSEQMASELAEVRDFQAKRGSNMARAGAYWRGDPAGRPAAPSPVAYDQAVFQWAPANHLIWSGELGQKSLEYRLDANPPRAARAYALTSVASHDATVAVYDAKYAYWAARPVHLDPTITTLLPTYPHPSYPSAHSAVIGATSVVLGHLFPRDAEMFASCAEEMAASRVWAGIHFRSDSDVGLSLGRQVAGKVVEWARADGSA
jgi:membrane-associated phospholipid phosphatase